MDFSAIKTLITQNIRTNNNEDITGNVLQQVLLGMIETLGDDAINDILANVDNIEDVIQNILNGGYGYGVYDISANHNGATYADLAAALGTNGANVPADIRRGGMRIQFVHSVGNKYVQYRLMSDSFNTTVANWQGVDDEPTAGSNNLVNSGGVSKAACTSINAHTDLEYDKAITSSSGIVSTKSDFFVTDYIPVENANSILWGCGVVRDGETNKVFLILFDSSKNVIEYYANSASNITPNVIDVSIRNPTVAANTRYIRASFYTPNKNSTFIAVNGNMLFAYNSDSAEFATKFKAAISIIANNIDDISYINALVKSKSFQGGLLYKGRKYIEQGNISSSTGEDTESTDRYRSIGYIKVPTGADSVSLVPDSNPARFGYFIKWYDDSSYLSETQVLDNISTIPSGATRARITIYSITGDINNIIHTDSDLLYFLGCDNNELFSSLKSKMSIAELYELFRLSSLDYTILDGKYIDNHNAVASNANWDLLEYFDISEVPTGHTLEVYSGGFSDLNTYAVVYNSSKVKRDNWRVNSAIREIVKQSTDTFISLSIYHTGLKDAYIKDKDTGKILFKVIDKLPYPKEKLLNKVTVAEWNVGHFGNGDASGIAPENYDTYLQNTKNVLTKLNADILFVCEYNRYIDRAGTIDAYNTILKQFYPYSVWYQGWCGIFSKYPLNASSYSHDIIIGGETETRYYIKGSVNINGVEIGILCLHDNPWSAADRVDENEFFVQEMSNYDLQIVSGDMNTGNNDESAQDIQSQNDVWTDAGYLIANYGYWGKKPTYWGTDPTTPGSQADRALDNIIVKGMNIDTLDVAEQPASSDHLAIVSKVTFWG